MFVSRLLGLADITPEDLDRRQAELWAMEDYGSKAQGAVLMVMGVADPLIGRFLPSPDTVRDALEETVAANLPESSSQPATGSSSATNTAPQPKPRRCIGDRTIRYFKPEKSSREPRVAAAKLAVHWIV